MTVENIYKVIDEIAPFSESMSFDNTGILVGNPKEEVTDVLLCLDITSCVLNEALNRGVQLIISHHPVIFNPLRTVKTDSIVYKLVQNNLSVISAHTNLDKAYPFGVNHALARALGLSNIRGIVPDGNSYIAYMGDLPTQMTAEDFGKEIKKALGLSALRYVKTDKPIHTVAIVSGAGGEYALDAAACGADAFVTGEVKHHEAIAALENGFAVYEAGHYHTEIVYRALLAEILQEKCPEVRFHISKCERPPMETL